MSEREKLSTVVNAAHVLALSIAQYGFAFIGSAIVSRTLGPAGRGAYYLPLLIATTAIAIGKLGVDQANVFLYGTSGIAPSRLSAQNGLITVCSGLMLSGIIVMLPAAVPSVFSGTPLALLLLAAVTIPLGIHAQLAGALLAMSGHVRRQYVAGLSSAVIQTICAVLVYKSGLLNVTTALLLAITGSAVSWAIIVAPQAGDRASWIGLDLSLLRTTLKSSLVLHLGMILFFLHLRVDMYMVKGMLGTAALGQYSISVTLAEALMLATDAVAVAVLPTQMGNTIREAAERALRAARINGMLGLVLACAAAVVCGPAIRLLFGRAFQPAVIPMLVLLPGIVSLGMQRVCGAPVLRVGRPAGIAAIYALTLCTNVVLNLVWIPAFGLTGASLASAVSYAIGAVLFLAWTSRLAHLPLIRAVRFDTADLATVSGAARSAIALLRGLAAPSREPL